MNGMFFDNEDDNQHVEFNASKNPLEREVDNVADAAKSVDPSLRIFPLEEVFQRILSASKAIQASGFVSEEQLADIEEGSEFKPGEVYAEPVFVVDREFELWDLNLARDQGVLLVNIITRNFCETYQDFMMYVQGLCEFDNVAVEYVANPAFVGEAKNKWRKTLREAKEKKLMQEVTRAWLDAKKQLPPEDFVPKRFREALKRSNAITSSQGMGNGMYFFKKP